MSTTFLTVPSSASTGSRAATRIILPCLPESAGPNERDIFMAFIKSFREGPNRRMEVRLLTAIHRAADATDNSDAYVSRVLVDMGLMAPRLAYPGDFLDHVDATLLRDRPLRSVPPSYITLTQHWVAIGDEGSNLRNSATMPENRLHSFLATV
ncbi:MAG: hypothetical protein KGQ41_07480 [Alphaproteobacteria bacterium]|nr:hypothetical protein [Alphaproteobacteria bacterium]